jgi:hypothetical protein
MPPRTDETTRRTFRLGDDVMAKLDRIAERIGVDRTTALKLAVDAYDKQATPHREPRVKAMATKMDRSNP